VLANLGVDVIDAAVSAAPEDVAKRAWATDFVAVSSYCGVGLDYVRDLRLQMVQLGIVMPIFIGGKLNRIPEDSQTSLPVDVSGSLR